MATLVFSAVGTLVGGPFGGAVGALVGRQVDSAIIGSGSRQGPRLKELNATTSSYGSAIARHFGSMRVPGTILWSTELVEHSESQSTGKTGPSVTSYAYSVSFAVALASRPIAGVGRIWADGNLLRGAGGDLKTGGMFRIYTGEHDQDPDPLIAAVEGADRCPAYRGLAYVVFEDLELADFYNRIPALTFEVLADGGGFSLQDIVDAFVEDCDADLALPGLSGFSCEGPLAQTLQLLDPMFPMDCDAGGELLTFAKERLQAGPLALPEPAISVNDDDFGGVSGFARKRSPAPTRAPEILRYYDIDRDYLPSVQRALGRAGPGQPETIELPAALHASDARDIVERTARYVDWSREKLAWRTTELDPAVGPGSVVTLQGQHGLWRVYEWEWRNTGVEFSLSRVVPTGPDRVVPVAVDPGRINPPVDLLAPPTLLAAVELPWDGSGTGDTPIPVAAVSSPAENWKGAALFVDHGDGNLQSLGPSGRTRSIVGSVEGILAPAHPLLIDRSSSVIVVLADDAMALTNADGRQLAQGANRALIGHEFIQFGRAVPLGNARWRLEQLLRGRGGRESAVAGHVASELFILLDGRPRPLDPALIGTAAGATILASGLGDENPVTTPIMLEGITRRPLSPVHARITWLAGDGLELGWTRRARGAMTWDDGIEIPLNEQSETYRLTLGPLAAPLATWVLTEPRLAIHAPTLASLPPGDLNVCQLGSFAVSEPLFLAALP